ncbi:MAG: hypothetical protein ACYC4S_17925 [Rhodoferax sp.]
MDTFEKRLSYAVGLCRRRAGTKNKASTRDLCNCIERHDGEKLMSELVRLAHRSQKLNTGVRLLFCVDHINKAAARFGVPPLPALDALKS